MANYEYTRQQLSGQWDAPNNPFKTVPVPLSKELEAALPGVSFTLLAKGTLLCLITAEDLTSEQKTAADSAVTAHQAVEDALRPQRLSMCQFLDERTCELFSAGMVCSGKAFSMSQWAQINWTNLGSRADSQTYPMTLTTLDDLDDLTLADQAAAEAFFQAFVSCKESILAPARACKKAIMAAATQAELDAAVDPR